MNASKHLGKASPVEKHRCEGFMQAGVVLGAATNEELQERIEAIHLDVFGQTVKEREKARASGWKEDAVDYSQYELSPTLRE